MVIRLLPILLLIGTICNVQSQNLSDFETEILQSIDDRAAIYEKTASQIWSLAELGYQEHQSSGLLQTLLQEAGFNIVPGVADIPTAFTATFGSGKPIIGVLGEFDALPGISQAAIPAKKAYTGSDNGHACGHHLFGTASAAAAIAVKEWLVKSGQSGTIRFYGTPAEEGGAGKVYMARAGLFDDVDVVLHWHPGDGNSSNPSSSLANMSAKFRFYGQAAHAAAAPHRGRSALDGVEAMNYMVNLMREHTTEPTRIHYVITKGGEAPNVIPAFAEVFYYVRHPDREEVRDLFNRLINAAEGAALGTDTRMEYELIHGSYNVLPNVTLARIMHNNLTKVGGVKYDPEEATFAEQLIPTLHRDNIDLASAERVQPFDDTYVVYPASTDVGDVSWQAPTTGLRTATWVPGTPAHSWQAVAAGGMSIGHKGMLNAAKVLSLTAVDLLQHPEKCTAARKEFEDRIGPSFVYKALLGDREPPLDYRN